MKRISLMAALLLISLSSCSTVIFKFQSEKPDIVPSDDNFYKGVKTYAVRTANQNVVYNQQELTSDVNVAISTIENELLKNGLKVIKGNADVIIELVSIDNPAYSTNTVYKSNGKTKTYDCNFSFKGLRIYLKAIRGESFVNYTFYKAPCEEGCEYKKIDKNCNKVPIGIYQDQTPSYEANAKDNPKDVVRISKVAAREIIQAIKGN